MAFPIKERRKYDLLFQQSKTLSIDLEKISTVKAIYNRVPGLQVNTNQLYFNQVVSNKKHLGMIFQRFYKHYENDFNFAPQTFALPQESEALQNYMKKYKEKTFIAKPQGGAEGLGIFLLKNFKELPPYTFQQEYIVQEYLDKPLLVDNKKFDLRIYVMVTSVDPLIAYIADEALVRFCTEDYQKPDRDNMHKILQHLTNFSLNKLSDKYVNCQDINEQNEATKRTLTALMQTLSTQGIDTDYLFEQIKDCCTKALIAIQPFVLREQEQMINMQKAQGDCFQILGFDIFIDDKLKAWLFEINDHPSLNIFIEKEGEKGLIKEPSEIDKYIKMKILGEAIQLMKKKNLNRSEIERYKGWIKLLPSNEFEGYDSFYKAKLIYDKLVAKKGGSMSSSKFSKLAKFKGMVNPNMTQTNYEILYKKVLQQTTSKQMTLEIFFDALENLADVLYPMELEKVDMLISNIISNMQ
ncbi:tubulin-tyrosine ligase family protein [Stylonychia lemnae]|uniref:Tubulin-tyrosine ligase family protein n=1 Tax=Stylonychia lemnae TaxID=5949 RepID=A0A077ZYN7_STYLE|nr:tubulin-tyrosine ligase family protein [Stylonychia lemnae]|eukprot:CDW75061.1 tubulin-tyrosine ligase family protein [Stylonychia lemnae]